MIWLSRGKMNDHMVASTVEKINKHKEMKTALLHEDKIAYSVCGTRF